MKKISDTRHYTSMILLLKRIKRKNLAVNSSKIDWHIQNYESLLELVQDR